MCILLNVKKHEKTFVLNVDIFKNVNKCKKLLTKDAGHDSITKLSLMRRQAPNRNRNKRRRLPGGRPQKDF